MSYILWEEEGGKKKNRGKWKTQSSNIYCTDDTKYLSRTPGSHSAYACAIRGQPENSLRQERTHVTLLWLSGRALVTQARGGLHGFEKSLAFSLSSIIAS